MNFKRTWETFKGEHTMDWEGAVWYGDFGCMKTEIGDVTVTPIMRWQWANFMPEPREWKRTWINERFEHVLPATNVGLDDIATFIGRVRNRTGVEFRLPTSDEYYQMGVVDYLRVNGRSFQNLDEMGTFAWQPFMQPVGMSRRSDWGLYDTWGCVWQWCADGPENLTVTQPSGTEYTYPQRYIFGGSWRYRAKDILPGIFGGRDGYKFNAHAEVSGHDVGFRLIRVVKNESGNGGTGSVDERK